MVDQIDYKTPLTTARNTSIFGVKSLSAHVQQRVADSFPGIIHAIHDIVEWNVGNVVNFLQRCYIGDCGGHHELPTQEKTFNTIDCPWNTGGQQGVNLACCHAYKENFKLQGAFPRIAAVLFFAEKNGWIDSKACIGFTKLLKDTGEILIKMDTEHRGKTTVPKEELENFKKRQRELGTIVWQEVVMPMIGIFSKN